MRALMRACQGFLASLYWNELSSNQLKQLLQGFVSHTQCLAGSVEACPVSLPSLDLRIGYPKNTKDIGQRR